nr:hypothetical protein BACY1_18310 [Tenacibaculum mesophilum]
MDDDDLLSDNYLKNIYSILESDSIIITNVKSFKVTINRSNLDYLGRAFLNIRNKRFSLYIYRSFFLVRVVKQ